MITNNNDIPLAQGTSVAIPQTLLLGLSAGICATLLSLGIAYFVMAYGLLKGKGWAWTITILILLLQTPIGIPQAFALNNDQRFQIGFRNGCNDIVVS
jgi:hypothetical protein